MKLGIRNEQLGIRNRKDSLYSSLLIPHSSFKKPHSSLLIPNLITLLLLAACSFDYGAAEGGDRNQPDVVMDNVEYVRVRSGDPQARFMAQRAERYEERRLMELQIFSFEQFEKRTGDINASGRVGSAEIRTDTGDIRMDNGVTIEVETEDIIIQTRQLEWKDNERVLLGGTDEPVNILRANGTSFSGIGFSADARRRTWEFSGDVDGTYIHDDEEEEATGADAAQDSGDAGNEESNNTLIGESGEL